jgi:thiol-disulfide isomerase/thioredoxin
VKKAILFIVGVLCAVASCRSQSPPLHALTIGDKVPDITFNHILNYKDTTARLSDFRGKLVILDFWSTSCSSCIELFPHLQSLQKQFPSDVQFILVNGKSAQWHDDKPKIERLLSHLSERTQKPVLLPIVYNCLPLDTLFPWNTIPHEVWIGKEGRVIAVTGASEVTALNIGSIRQGEIPHMQMKRDISYDLQKHTLQDFIHGISSYNNNVLTASIILSGDISNLPATIGLRHADNSQKKLYTGFYVVNRSLYDLYRYAFRDKMQVAPNRVFIEARNPERFNTSHADDYARLPERYSYDITVRPTTFDKLLSAVRGDLEKAFQATVVTERRLIPCYVVHTTAKAAKAYTNNGKRIARIDKIDAKKYVRNYPLSALLQYVDQKYFRIPLVDETGYNGNVNLALADTLSQAAIVRSLRGAGFTVERQKRYMDVAFIINKPSADRSDFYTKK